MTLKKTITISALSFLLVCTSPVLMQAHYSAFASEPAGKQEAALTTKVDTKNLSGVDLLIANLYNDDKVLYAIVVTMVMAVLGTSLAFLTDLVLKALGLEVSRISHRE
jgi:ABC-type phosphate/phosphonate transport system permease subunit